MQWDDGRVISDTGIIEPRSSLLLTCGGFTERRAGYNSQVIDIHIIQMT